MRGRRVLICCETCGKEVKKLITSKDALPRFCSRKCAEESRKKAHPNKLLPWTPQHDSLIRFSYNNFKNRTKAINFLKKEFIFKEFSRAQISRRAKQLGLIPKKIKNKKFSEKEKELVENLIGYKHPRDISRLLKKKGYNRTTKAIQQYCHRNGYSYRLDIYNLEEVREALGFPSTKRVKKWIKDGLLICKEKTGKQYEIKPIALAKFIREHPFELLRYKVDLPFIIALLDEFKPHKTKNWGVKHGNNIQKDEDIKFQEY